MPNDLECGSYSPKKPQKKKLDYPIIIFLILVVIVTFTAGYFTGKWWPVWQQNISALFIPDSPPTVVVSSPTPVPTPTAVPTPVPTVSATPTPEPTPEPVYINDETHYQDANIDISLESIKENKIMYFVADIKLTDASYLKTALANETLGNEHEKTSVMAKKNDAIVAMSGDYCGFDGKGIIIRNGQILRSVPEEGEMLVLYKDGRLEVIDAKTADPEALIQNGVLQSWTFGPWLVKDGVLREDWSNQNLKAKNPRAVLGMVEPLHYKFVVVDGRSKFSEGITLKNLAQLMSDLGCKLAYNMDGGGTATLIFRDTLINRPLGKQTERGISDILYIGPNTQDDEADAAEAAAKPE